MKKDKISMLSPVILLSYPLIGIILLVFKPFKKDIAVGSNSTEKKELLVALVVTL
jgi:hypothetical protein